MDSGFDRIQALRWNLLSGAATIPGAVLAYVTLGSLQTLVGPILALSAARLIYVGLADVVPGLHRRIGPNMEVVAGASDCGGYRDGHWPSMESGLTGVPCEPGQTCRGGSDA